MEYIHEVCHKIGVQYFLSYGSLIGAVRHKGFIPWDDDVDISMFREDYEIFLEKAPALLRPDFCIQNGRTDNYFPAVNTNLSLKGTVCVPDEL